MIDLKDLREHPDKYRLGAEAKRIVVEIDRLLEIDAELRGVQSEREQITAEKNRVGKEIGPLVGRIKKASGDEKASLEAQLVELKQKPESMKAREQELLKQEAELARRREELCLQIPQPPDDDVPRGASAEDNVEIRRWNPEGFDPSKSFTDNKGFKPKSHIELMQNLGVVDFARGVKLSGSRSYVLRGAGMRLHQAVLRFAFDFMTSENGFQAVSAPCLVREQTMVGTAFFPHGRETAYHISNPTSEEQLYLAGTGEVGLMGLHTDEVLDPDTLPLCYTTLSTCFRREAGAAGKDTAGLYRIHQFDKVEQVVICKAVEAESRAWHQKMIGFVESLLQRLELPYRLLQCCTADLGAKNADMIDIECWMPSREGYGETHSASRLYDYQCRRLGIRYRDPDTKKNVIAHSLNNTVVASPRILIPLVELNQNRDGSITIPAALRPYMNGLDAIG